MIRRTDQFLLIATLLPLCWLSMMAVHEGGHFLCARLTNGTVTSVVLQMLWGFGLLTIPTGFWVWHGAGADFGFGPPAKALDRVAPKLTAMLLVIIVGLELLFGHT